MNNKKIFLLIFIPSFLSLFSCTSKPDTSQPDFHVIPNSFSWEYNSNGIYTSDVYLPEIPLIYHLVKIDLSSDYFEICAYNANTNNHKGLSISDFSKNSLVAFNTIPFTASSLYHIFPNSRFVKFKTLGIHKENDMLFSNPLPRYSVLLFFK
ncbi:MAG: hypothetical protein HUK25_05250, partial [Treponema sp.]|nr:hypothetical protein [Treponema sp.]